MHTSYTVYIPPARHSQASGAITSPWQGQARSRKRSHEPGNSCDGLYFRPILPLPDTQELALRSHQQLGLVESRVAATATISVPITTPCQTSLSAQQLQPISPPPSSKRQRVQPLKPINSKSSLTAVPTPTGAERYDDTIIADSEGESEGSEEEEEEEEDVYGGAVDSGGGGGTFDITKTGRERWDTTAHTTERSRRDKSALDYAATTYSHPAITQGTSESFQTNVTTTSNETTTASAATPASILATNPDSRSILVPDIQIPNLSNLPTLHSLLRPSGMTDRFGQSRQPTTKTSTVSVLVAVLSISPIRWIPTKFPQSTRGATRSKFQFAESAGEREVARDMAAINQSKTRFCEITIGQPGIEIGDSIVGVIAVWGEKTDWVGEDGLSIGDVVFLENLSHKQSIHPTTKHTMGTLSTTGHSTFTILSRTQPRYLYPVTGPTTCSTCELLAKGVLKDRKVCVKHMHLVVPEDRRYMVDERLADTIPGLGKVVRMGRWCKGVLGGKGVIRA